MTDEIKQGAIQAILENREDHGQQVMAVFMAVMQKYAGDSSPSADDCIGMAEALILQICLLEKAKSEGSISLDDYIISQVQTWSVLQVSNKTWASGISSAVIPHFITSLHNIVQSFHMLDLSKEAETKEQRDELITMAWMAYAKRFDFVPWLAYALLGHPLCMDAATNMLIPVSICKGGKEGFIKRFL